jgi:hypothetical protein
LHDFILLAQCLKQRFVFRIEKVFASLMNAVMANAKWQQQHRNAGGEPRCRRTTAVRSRRSVPWWRWLLLIACANVANLMTVQAS